MADPKTTKRIETELGLSHPPHIYSDDSIPRIMWLVVIALLPASIYAILLFGKPALLVMLASVVSAVAAEGAFQALMKKPVTIQDGSAVVTGLLVAMNVPPNSPAWMSCIGSAFAIIIAKQLFGGLGFNIFNPALAARAFMMASWPVHMTTGWHQFSGKNILAQGITLPANMAPQVFDAVTGATPLAVLKEGPRLIGQAQFCGSGLDALLGSPSMIKALFLGNVGGCIGETSALLLLIGGVFMYINRIITWHVPVSYIGTVGILAGLYYSFTPCAVLPMVAFHVFAGGLFLGAIFMATDMVTTPLTGRGRILFGLGCGVLTFVIRIWGGYPEGVSYSILIMNAVVPLIDRYLKPRVFGMIN